MRVFMRPGSSSWWVDFHVGDQRFRESAGTHVKQEAQRRLAQRLLEEQSKAATAPAGLPSLRACYGTWVKTLPACRRTRDDQKRVSAFLQFFGENQTTGAVQTVSVTRWLEALGKAGLAPATLKRHKTSLSAMFRWARGLGLAPGNPVEGALSPAVSRQRKAPCTSEEIRGTLGATMGTPLEAAYYLAFFAGLRREEIARARWEDVDLERGTITVRGTKTEESAAVLPLHSLLKQWLVAHKGTGPLVANRKGMGYCAGSLENLRREAKRDTPWLPNFHRARHTLASILLNEGASIENISKLLRHTSIRTTQEFYATPDAMSAKADLERLSV